jgi:hypothetical protein
LTLLPHETAASVTACRSAGMSNSTCQTADGEQRSRGVQRPRLADTRPSSRGEGAGKTGRRLAPMVRVQQKSTRQNHRFSRNHPAFPARWFYGLYVVSPVRPGFVVTVVGVMRKHHRRLSTCIGAPGPHDFAVRNNVIRLLTPLRPSHPAPNVRDDREAPLLWVRDARIIVLICPTRQRPSGCDRLARRAICAWRGYTVRCPPSLRWCVARRVGKGALREPAVRPRRWFKGGRAIALPCLS